MFRLTAAVIFLFFSTNLYLFAQEYHLSDKAKTNLLFCIQHENDGVRSSGVHYVGKYKVEEAIPLLCKILKEDKNLRIRKLAAYSLFRMNDSKGLFAIEEALRFNDNKEVRLFCSTIFEISLRE
ncbi:MAG: HEAT repeat domain-containing protein [Melioribacteraceae bacterium]|nr:HEAT repeat domain-containing protein [Melioribacteraceae bacterium]